MAGYRVYDFSSFIKHQINSQEKVESYLWKLDALITVATMSDGLCELPENIFQNYFSIAADLIEKAGKANQESLNELLTK